MIESFKYSIRIVAKSCGNTNLGDEIYIELDKKIIAKMYCENADVDLKEAIKMLRKLNSTSDTILKQIS